MNSVLNRAGQDASIQHAILKPDHDDGQLLLNYIERHRIKDAFEIIARFVQPLDEPIELFGAGVIGHMLNAFAIDLGQQFGDALHSDDRPE
jgi:hypothetical protein